jgi:hypothetical protein
MPGVRFCLYSDVIGPAPPTAAVRPPQSIMSLIRKLTRHVRGPRCHVTPEQKQWVEERLLRLGAQFGPAPVRRPPLDPTSELLPRKWDGSCEAGADLCQRLCRFMAVDPARLQWQFYSQNETHDLRSACAGETHRTGPAGLFLHPKDTNRLIIALEESGLSEPAKLTATICHELGHVEGLVHRVPRGEFARSESLLGGGPQCSVSGLRRAAVRGRSGALPSTRQDLAAREPPLLLQALPAFAIFHLHRELPWSRVCPITPGKNR